MKEDKHGKEIAKFFTPDGRIIWPEMKAPERTVREQALSDELAELNKEAAKLMGLPRRYMGKNRS